MSNTTVKLSNPDLLKQQCLIKGQWQDASDGATIEVQNPFNGKVIGTIPSLTEQDVKNTVSYSKDVQVSWAATTAQERGEL